MKKIIAFLLLVLAVQASAAITLGKPGMVGTWIAPESQGFTSSISRLVKDEARDSLEIRSDLSVRLTRRFSDGKDHVLSAPPSMVSFHKDIMIAEFPYGGGAAKLVLSGWGNGHSKRVFGTLYLYDSNGLFNGIPVTFEPAAGS